MSRELFNLALDRIKKNSLDHPKVAITLDYGVSFIVYDLKMAKGKTNIAKGRINGTSEWVYFELAHLLNFHIEEDDNDKPENEPQEY